MSRFQMLPGWAHRRPRLFLLSWICLPLLAVSTIGGYALWLDYRRIVVAAAGTAQDYANTIAHRVEASVAKADVLLNMIVAEAAQAGPGDEQLSTTISHLLGAHPELALVMVVRADGSSTEASGPAPGSLNFSDRAYFRHHRDHPGTDVHLSPPEVSRLGGRMVIPITRRLEDARGRFAGIAFIGLRPEFFEQEFRQLQLGTGATVAISDSDGTILFRFPAVPGSIGSNIGNWEVFDTIIRRQNAGAGPSACPVDGVERLHAFRHLQRYPMIAFAGISLQSLEDEWLASLRLKLPLLAGMLLLLAAAGMLVLRQLRSEARTLRRLKVSLRRTDRVGRQVQALNRQLQQASDFQEAVLHSIGCGIFVTDVHGAVVFMNRASTAIIGFTPAEVVGQMSPLALHRTEDVRAALQRIRPGDTPYLLLVAYLNAHPGREWEWVRKDGSLVTVSLAVTTLTGTDGQTEGFVTIANDLSELRQLEDMKSDFVSVVSHELRTPVTAIRGALSLFQAAGGSALPASQQKLLGMATDNCDKLVRIVSDILDVDRLSRQRLVLTLARQPVLALVERAIDQTRAFAGQYAVTYRMVDSTTDLTLALDAERFVQILVNLLSNAAKFSPPGSEVVVSLSEEYRFAVIRVTDCGIGIPEAFQPHIFERFSQHGAALTRKTGGTGLGLAITKMLVEAHGGTISFTSEQGFGTTFAVFLRLSEDQGATEVPRESDLPPARG